ncbi:unnamed protein product, partial [Closterium sp. NIES-54]
DHILALDPTDLTVDLLEKHLLAAETRIVAVGAARGTPRTPFFEGCSPSPLAPSYASAAAVDILGIEDVGTSSSLSGRRRSSKGKGGKSGGGGSGGGGGGGSGGGGGGVGGGSGGSGGRSGGFGGGGGGSGGGGGGGGGGSGSGGSSGGDRGGATQRGGSGGGTFGKFHTEHRCFSRLDDAWRVEFGDEAKRPRWLELLRSGVDIFALDYDAILAAMYAMSVSAEGDCYLCVPPDPGIEAAALSASESALPGTALAEALHNFILDSGASRCFFRDSLHLPSFSTNLVSTTALQDAMVTTTTPGGQRVSIYTCTQTTESPQVPASGPVVAPCSCRLLSHQTLLWHHRLGHPSLPRLRGMHSRLLVSGLPRSLPPLPSSPASPCLPCVKERQRAAPHSSSFPRTTTPLQTLHMDVWGPARVSGQSRERYFLLVVHDYTRYTTVFPLRSKDEVPGVLIPWIRAVRLQLRERFCQDLPVLRLHFERGGEFSSDLLRELCCGEGILQSFTLPASPQKNGVTERRIGLVMEVARTSMIHAAVPHFLWPFVVWYAAHQLNLWPRVSLPETSPTLRWTGKVGDASVFRVWGSRAFVRDTSTDKLSSCAIPRVFLGFPPDALGWQFYHPTSHRVLPSQDVTFDELVPFYRLFPYRTAPLPPPPPLFLAPSPPPVEPLPPQGPAPSGVSQLDPLPRAVPVQVAVYSGAARGVASGGAASGGAASRGAEPAILEPGGAGPEGAELGGAESEGVEFGGAEPEGAERGGTEPEGAEPGGAESEGAESGGVEPRGTASAGGPAGASP